MTMSLQPEGAATESEKPQRDQHEQRSDDKNSDPATRPAATRGWTPMGGRWLAPTRRRRSATRRRLALGCRRGGNGRWAVGASWLGAIGPRARRHVLVDHVDHLL